MQECNRINCGFVYGRWGVAVDLEVQVWSGGVAGGADPADDLSRDNLLAGAHG
jgi:hypothetical protein